MGGPIEWNITQIVAPCDLDASFILNNKAKKNTQVMRYTFYLLTDVYMLNARGV